MSEVSVIHQEKLLDQLRGTLSRMELALDAVSEAILLMDLDGSFGGATAPSIG